MILYESSAVWYLKKYWFQLQKNYLKKNLCYFQQTRSHSLIHKLKFFLVDPIWQKSFLRAVPDVKCYKKNLEVQLFSWLNSVNFLVSGQTLQPYQSCDTRWCLSDLHCGQSEQSPHNDQVNNLILPKSTGGCDIVYYGWYCPELSCTWMCMSLSWVMFCSATCPSSILCSNSTLAPLKLLFSTVISWKNFSSSWFSKLSISSRREVFWSFRSAMWSVRRLISVAFSSRRSSRNLKSFFFKTFFRFLFCFFHVR